MTRVQVGVEPFRFPNYLHASTLKVPGTNEPARFSVADLTDEDALAYWDAMRDAWLKHVQQRRRDGL